MAQQKPALNLFEALSIIRKQFAEEEATNFVMS